MAIYVEVSFFSFSFFNIISVTRTIYTHGLDGALTDTDSVAVGEELADLKWRFPPLRSFLIIEKRERRREAQRMAQR